MSILFYHKKRPDVNTQTFFVFAFHHHRNSPTAEIAKYVSRKTGRIKKVHDSFFIIPQQKKKTRIDNSG